jgi:5-methylcytosine-specific restriction endonuclease McrA
MLEERDGTATGKSTSGPGIAKHYADWRSKLPEELGVRTDPRRVFNEDQKLQMLARDGSNCKECGDPLTLEDAEGDHYPKPWREGGRTEIDNGRLLHKKCHQRGRPLAAVIG